MSAYDKQYYDHYGPIPYDRGYPQWASFFGMIARRITETLRPASVMDVGCAKGFLVEAFRDLGVEAFGRDISAYAVSEVREDVKPYCEVASATEPFARDYDLITCIEVLEHLTEADGDLALSNICRHARIVLFSSTPSEFYDSTHINVRPRSYWIKKFAENGFYADVDFDASFVSPSAVLFRRISTSHHVFNVAHYALEPPSSQQSVVRVVGPMAHLASRGEACLLRGCQPAAGSVEVAFEPVKEADVVVIQGYFPLVGKPFLQLYETAHRAGVPVIYDLDGLLFDLPEDHPEYTAYGHRAPEIIEALQRADAVTVPTASLQSALVSLGVSAHVLPDCLDDNIWRMRNVGDNGTDVVTIGLIGTPGHEANLTAVRDVLRKVGERYGSRVRFCFIGVHLDDVPESSMFLPFSIDYRWAYPSLLLRSGIDIGLAPLLPTRFNRMTGYTRFLEYSAAGIAGVYSNFVPYHDIVRPDVTGLLVGNDSDAWFDAICRLVEDADLRSRIVRNAQADIRARWLMSREASRWLDLYSWVKNRFDARRKWREAVNRREASAGSGGPTSPRGDAGRAARAIRHARPNLSVSVIILMPSGSRFTLSHLEAARRAAGRYSSEIILVQGKGADQTRGLPESHVPMTVVQTDSEWTLASAFNRGAMAGKGEYLAFLSGDVEVGVEWLAALIEAAQASGDVGVVGSKLLTPDGRIEHAGVEIRYAGPYPLMPSRVRYMEPDEADGTKEGPADVDAVTGAAMLVRRDVFEAVGGFDERYKNGYEDVDFCLRVRARGYRVLYEPRSVAISHGDKAPKNHDYGLENLTLFHRLWMHRILDMRKTRKTSAAEGPTSNRPPVSVVVVTYNSLRTIAPCIESVLATLGPKDEIIVVDNASQDETAYYLETLAEQEHRLVVQALGANMGYAAGAAAGVRLAKNDFVVFLNPDAVVFGPWIDQLLQPMLQNSNVAATGPVSNYAAGLQNLVLYAKPHDGEFSIAEIREDLAAHWQGKFAETKLLIGFCLAIRRGVLDEIGGLDEALYLGNDDLDLSWRLQQAGYKQMVVPSVFVYHQGQASFRTEPKTRTAYLVQQSANQLYEKLYAAYQGKVPSGEELWSIGWFTPQRDLLSIVIPIQRDAVATRQCLNSLVKYTHRPYEVILVDNAADDETRRVIQELSQHFDSLKVITNDANLGYPRACNQGLAAASGDYIAVMNNDVIVTPHWASRLLAAFSVDPQIGAVGPRTNFAVGPQRVESANYTLEELDRWSARWHRDHAGKLQPTARLIGFFVVLKRQLLEDIGGFDPLYGIGNFEDDDLSLRALLSGYKLVIAGDVFIHHHGSRSFGSMPQRYVRLMETNRALFAAKWGVSFENGAYSPMEVVNRGGHRLEDLFIPLPFDTMFSPEVEPLDVGCHASHRLLCIPDPSDSLESWLDLFENYFRAFGAPDARVGAGRGCSGRAGESRGSSVGNQALIIRAEPAEQTWIDRLVNGLKSVAERIGINLDEREDLFIEARALPSAARGRVYRAATVFVPLPGVRHDSLIREAQACGLKILSGYSPEDFLREVRSGPCEAVR